MRLPVDVDGKTRQSPPRQREAAHRTACSAAAPADGVRSEAGGATGVTGLGDVLPLKVDGAFWRYKQNKNTIHNIYRYRILFIE